ncbi:YkyA family protein [Facklamia sp. DSM 111018]|uniref:YkyA family protein n=1 Tax=Facklamia lactis TaxID=2749967 RepID=A0ABS0LMR3_9LACT|nr:YkyA family protein [Facklamia lactis]MBG9979869.1 YkyA family protein [Facklamia lactis]MBG9985451.1 YkyA family protein [Facklamia lactis]
MKNKKLILLGITLILLSGCGNSIERASRTIGLIQENVTNIIGKISEVQNQESDLQADFEETLKESDDLSAFAKDTNPVIGNIQEREQLLTDIDSSRQDLLELIEELNQIPEHKDLPDEQTQKVIEYIQALCEDLELYVSNYQENLKVEADTFKSVANPEINHESFFGVFDNINDLAIENNINLDAVLGHFESLNVLLVNLKVYLVNLTDK